MLKSLIRTEVIACRLTRRERRAFVNKMHNEKVSGAGTPSLMLRKLAVDWTRNEMKYLDKRKQKIAPEMYDIRLRGLKASNNHEMAETRPKNGRRKHAKNGRRHRRLKLKNIGKRHQSSGRTRTRRPRGKAASFHGQS